MVALTNVENRWWGTRFDIRLLTEIWKRVFQRGGSGSLTAWVPRTWGMSALDGRGPKCCGALLWLHLEVGVCQRDK